MELDFTALDRIATQTAQRDFTEPLGDVVGTSALQPAKPATGQNKSHSGQAEHTIPYRLNKERQERENIRQMYAQYQTNIKRAGCLRTDILKGITKGEDPLALLLKAVECISLMAGDTVIHTQSKEDILAIYGYGLGEVAPLHTELEEAQHRLAMLERPELLEGDTSPDTRQRISKAIEAHRKHITALEAEIDRLEHEADIEGASYE